MSLLAPWIGLPLALGLVSLGCALALELVAGVRLARALLLPAGLAVVIVVAQLLTAVSATAVLATPAVVVVAVAGLVLGRRRARRAYGPWLLAALVVYLFYGAPVLATGAATFTGYITLDDTTSWLSIVDHVMSHGRSLHDLTPSTYSLTLSSYLPGGYPLGGFLGLGVTHQLTGIDSMWLYQPFLAYTGAMLALTLYELSRRFLTRPLASLAVATVAAQSATLYGYSLWGGIKEMVAAAMMPLIAALASGLRGEPRGPLAGARAMLPLAVACSALLATLSFGAIVWIVPLALPALLAAVKPVAGAWWRRPWRALRLRNIAWLALIGAILSAPVLDLAVTFLRPLFMSGPGGGGVFASGAEKGNLIQRLDLRQLAGIWPAGDFRLGAHAVGVVDALIALAVALAAVAVVLAWRRGQRALPVYVVTAVVLVLAIRTHSSPWVDGKAIAQSSPAIVFAALCAGLLGWRRRELRWLGCGAAALVTAGVLWSNALAYHAVNIAPRDQLLELQHIAGLAAGEGPTLYTDASYIGPRHILRAADAETAFGVRSRRTPLADGSLLPSYAAADLDVFNPKGIWAYRSLVVRRAPDNSRPSSLYHLRWAGRFYELWQRAPDAKQPPARVTLGHIFQPGTVPHCADVMRVAHSVGPKGRLEAVFRRSPDSFGLGNGPRPKGWKAINLPGAVVPSGAGTIERLVTIPVGGRVSVWLGGSSRGLTTLSIDGHRVARLRHELNWPGRYTQLGYVDLKSGEHRVTLRYDDGGLHPGAGQEVNPYAFGPLVFGHDDDVRPIVTVPATKARTLCGQRLDWIEAFGLG